MANVDRAAGKPDVLFYQPEVYGTVDYGLPVHIDLDRLAAAVGAKAPPEHGCCDEFAEAALTIMVNRGYNLPRSYEDGLRLFANLTDNLARY